MMVGRPLLKLLDPGSDKFMKIESYTRFAAGLPDRLGESAGKNYRRGRVGRDRGTGARPPLLRRAAVTTGRRQGRAVRR